MHFELGSLAYTEHREGNELPRSVPLCSSVRRVSASYRTANRSRATGDSVPISPRNRGIARTLCLAESYPDRDVGRPGILEAQLRRSDHHVAAAHARCRRAALHPLPLSEPRSICAAFIDHHSWSPGTSPPDRAFAPESQRRIRNWGNLTAAVQTENGPCWVLHRDLKPRKLAVSRKREDSLPRAE